MPARSSSGRIPAHADRDVGGPLPPGAAEGVADDHGDLRAGELPQPLAQPGRRGVRVLGQQDDACPASGAFEAVDAGGGADESVPGLGDHERRAVRTIRADSRRITSSRRGSSPPRVRAPARTARPRPAARPGPRPSRRPSARPRARRRPRARPARAISAPRSSPSRISGSPSTGPDRDHGRPVMRRPAWTPSCLFTFRITAVIASRAREFASGPASSARPPTRLPASSSASSFAPGRPRRSRRPGRAAPDPRGRSPRPTAGPRRRGARMILATSSASEPLVQAGHDPDVGEAQVARHAEHGRLADRVGQLAAAVSSAAFDLSPSTTRSAPRTTSSLLPPSTPSSSALSRARCASREPMQTSSPSSLRAAARARGRRRRCRRGSRPSPQRRCRLEHRVGHPAAALASLHQRARDDRAHARFGRPRRPRRSRARRSGPCNSRSRAAGRFRPRRRDSIRAAGPRTARPPISGLTATARHATAARAPRGSPRPPGSGRC